VYVCVCVCVCVLVGGWVWVYVSDRWVATYARERMRLNRPYISIQPSICKYINLSLYTSIYTSYMYLHIQTHARAHTHTNNAVIQHVRTHAAYSRIVSARTRSHAYARTHASPFTHPDFASMYINIFIHDVCVGYIYRRAYPCAHVMATAASSARAIASQARVRAMRCSRMHAHTHL
jgi:hypothetical protein